MPIIQVNLMQGRTDEQKKVLAQRITQSVVEVLGSKREAVRVLFHEMGPYDFCIGGVPIGERDAPPNPQP
jgi:4-oxalocrotonate tautomerase